MKYLSERNLSFIALLAYVLIVCVVLNETIYAASDKFADKYRTYQAEVRAGKESFDKKDYQSSIAHYSKAIEMSPFEASSYFQRGVALYKTGKDKEAVEDFDRALIIDPRMISAYGYRGLCKEKLGNYGEALKDYVTAVSMNPKDANIHNNLAWLYATAKDEKVKDNIKSLEHAVRASEMSNGGNADILDTLAMAYFINGKVKEAIETEQKALKLEPNNERFKGNLKKYEEVKGE